MLYIETPASHSVAVVAEDQVCTQISSHHLLGVVEGDVLASLAPPVHLSGERLGWTLLVCMVGDFRSGHLEVSWRSPSEGHVSSSPYSVALGGKHRGNSAVAIITVATRDWPSYSCSVSHRRRPKVARRRQITSSGRTKADPEFGSLFLSSKTNIHHFPI